MTARWSHPGLELRQSKRDVAESAGLRRCSHPFCRTSLDEIPSECPHGMPFCEHCIWEEVCSECAS